jgi:hypothetical protein
MGYDSLAANFAAEIAVAMDLIESWGPATDDQFESAGCSVFKYSWMFFGASARFTAAAIAG